MIATALPRYAVRVCALALVALIGAMTAPAAMAQSGQTWTVAGIGAPTEAAAGQVSCPSPASASCLAFSVRSRSADIWGSSDSFTFVYRQLAGDGSIVARVDSVEAVNAWTKAGVMIRRSLSATAENGYTLISADRGAALQVRTGNGSSTMSFAGATLAAPAWVRLDRRGNTITAWDSPDGTNWHQIISGNLTLDPIVYVGVAVTSHDTSLTATANVSNISVYPASLPSPWATAAVGGATLSGEASPVGTGLAATSGGADVYGTADQFRYIYQRITGDVDLYTRVSSLDAPNEWTKAGVMIRSSLNADAAQAFMLVSGSRGLAFQRRPADGLSTISTAGGAGQASVWVKLEKRGAVVNAYRSDGITWTPIGSETMDLPSTYYVGLAITSHDTARLATAIFDNTTIVVRTATNTPPAVSFTSPAPASTYAPTQAVNLAVNATDADGSVTRVDFYVDGVLYNSDTVSPYATSWQPTSTGSHTLSAVARDNAGATATANVTIQVSSTPVNASPLVAITAPTAGSTVGPAPATIPVSANASDTDGTIARVDFFVGTTLIGSDTTAPYSVSWAGVAAGTYSLTAVATDNSGATTTSAAASVTVSGSQGTSTTTAVFVPSTDNTNVDYYVVEIYAASSGAMVSTTNIGKPAVVNGECRADISSQVSALPAGSYAARVRAVNAFGGTASALSTTFTR